MEELRENIKTLIGIQDNSQDALLNLIIDSISSRLCILLGADAVPFELEHIVEEVCVIRFNRIGSEGANSHTVEGESVTFNDNDFAAYMPEIKAYKENNAEVKKGKVRFI